MAPKFQSYILISGGGVGVVELFIGSHQHWIFVYSRLRVKSKMRLFTRPGGWVEFGGI